MKHIYVVEDHEAILLSVSRYLEMSGFQVSSFAKIRDAEAAIDLKCPDLLVQDIMMGDGDGLEFVRQLRLRYEFPVVFMTAKGTQEDRIRGFESGADDYVVKPFSPKELILRIEAIFRRMGTSSREHREETVWHKDGTSLVCDDLSHVMTIDGKDLGLTAAEWRVLRHLIANAGTLVTRDDILGSCFDYTYESYDRIVDTHIKNIRAKLGGQGNAWIETVRGYGYRFAGNLVR